MPGNIEGALAADGAVAAVGRDRSLDNGDVLPLVFLYRLFLRLFGEVPGSGHDGLMVVDRQNIEDDVGGCRLV